MKDNSRRVTLVYVSLMIALGVVGYLATGFQSITALIPAFFGIFVFGMMFLLPRLVRLSVIPWILIAMAAIGFLATASGVPKVAVMVMGDEIARPAAAISQTVMAVLSFAYGLAILNSVRKHKTG